MGVPGPTAATPTARAHSASTDSSDPSPPAQTVPKLNLTPVLQQRDDEIGDAPAYKVAHSNGKGGTAGSHPLADPVDHFYYYPKLDSKTERQTLDIIEHMPKKEREHMKQIFESMVEARQNCEAIAFRGHRLLDQLNSHMREQVCTERGEKTELQTQLVEYQKRVQEQECQLASLKMILQGMQGLSQSGVLGHVGGMLSSLGVDVTGAGASGSGTAADGGSVGDVSQAEQDLLRDINALSSEMTSVRNTVNHLSSRLGGVVAPPGSGLSAALLDGGGGIHGLGWPAAGGDAHWARDQPPPVHQQQRSSVDEGGVVPTAAANAAPRPVPALNLAFVKPLPTAAMGEDDCAQVLDVDC